MRQGMQMRSSAPSNNINAISPLNAHQIEDHPNDELVDYSRTNTNNSGGPNKIHFFKFD